MGASRYSVYLLHWYNSTCFTGTKVQILTDGCLKRFKAIQNEQCGKELCDFCWNPTRGAGRGGVHALGEGVSQHHTPIDKSGISGDELGDELSIDDWEGDTDEVVRQDDKHVQAGTQFTCFTSTKVQILTRCLAPLLNDRSAVERRRCSRTVLRKKQRKKQPASEARVQITPENRH